MPAPLPEITINKVSLMTALGITYQEIEVLSSVVALRVSINHINCTVFILMERVAPTS
jgi:hypothetical protein